MEKSKTIAILLALTALLFFPAGGYLSYLFLNNTKLIYEAPKGSIVGKAQTLAAEYFTSQIGNKPMFMLIRELNTSQSIVDDPCFREYSDAFNASIHAGGTLFGDVLAVEGYYFVPDVPAYRAKLVGGPNNDSTVFNIFVSEEPSMTDFANRIQQFNAEWSAQSNCTSLSFAYTSVDEISQDLEHGIIGDLMIIDGISLPLAFLALAYCLGSLRLLLIPGATVPMTIVLAFSAMYPVSRVTNVSSFAPEMAAACMMAISVDYALFVLSRFLEQVELQEAKFGKSPATQWLVIKNTTILSAHNVLVSGLTIAVALGGLSFLPISFLSTIGMTMSAGACSAVIVSLTLQPILLYIFYDFFAQPGEMQAIKEKILACRKRFGSSTEKSDESASSSPPPVAASAAQNEEESSPLLLTSSPHKQTSPKKGRDSNNNSTYSMRETTSPLVAAAVDSEDTVGEYHKKQFLEQNSSIWFRIGRLSFQHPLITVLLVCAVGVPFFYYASELQVDFDLFNQVPRDSPHAATLKTIVAEIGHGAATPFYVTFIGNADTTVWGSPLYLDVVNNLTLAVSLRAHQPLNRIMSPSLIPDPFNPEEMLFINRDASQFLYNTSAEYQFLFHRTVSESRTACLLQLYTTFDPFAAEANEYLNTLNDIVSEFQPLLPNVTIGFLGASSDSWAIMHAAMDLFPLQIGVTFGVIFVFIAAVFRSVFVPFRMVLTVAYTIAMSYGAGVIMFQFTWLRPVWPAMRSVESYSWTVPIFSFSLLCALALDYDVFLLTRIIEFKEMGYTNEAAIAKAVWKTGRIISFAGVIMFISFGSLVFSNTTMLNQFGAIAALAVAIDTFVIRSFFAPALMSIMPSCAWWPRKFKHEGLQRSLEDMRGPLEQFDVAGESVSSPRNYM